MPWDEIGKELMSAHLKDCTGKLLEPKSDEEPLPVEIIVPIFTVVKSSVERQCIHGRTTVKECHRETNFAILIDPGDELSLVPLCPQHIGYHAEEGLADLREWAPKTEDKQDG